MYVWANWQKGFRQKVLEIQDGELDGRLAIRLKKEAIEKEKEKEKQREREREKEKAELFGTGGSQIGIFFIIII
jgi:hypothetical protein